MQFFNFGPNSTTFIVPGECFPTRYRSTSHGLSAASGKVGAIIAQVVIGPLRVRGATKTNPSPWLPHVLEIFALQVPSHYDSELHSNCSIGSCWSASSLRSSSRRPRERRSKSLLERYLEPRTTTQSLPVILEKDTLLLRALRPAATARGMLRRLHRSNTGLRCDSSQNTTTIQQLRYATLL